MAKLGHLAKWMKQELLEQTDTLWENEVKANLFVARIMIYTSILDAIFIVMAYAGVFTMDRRIILSTLSQAMAELLIPAFLCFYLKGRKRWLKIILLAGYTIVLARIESVMTHNVTLAIAFPVVLSIRYYSRVVSVSTALLTTILSGMADYAAVMWKMGRIDMNMVSLNQGAVLSWDSYANIRDVIMSQAILDYADIWKSTFTQSYIPKIILYTMIAIISIEVAKWGRIAILEQKKESEKTERISTELNLASSIQANMLPNIFPAFPDRQDFDIYATMTPAKEVGGDFYDFFMIDDNRIALVMGDVSGKGIPAAMFMVIAKTLIKDHTQLGLEPKEVFTRVNNLLCEGNEAGLFVTAWLGIVDLITGEMTYVNAGHNPPVIRINGEIKYLSQKPGFILAGMEGYKYTQDKIKLNKGDGIFLYTDGATEATNKDSQLYGEERLINCLSSQNAATCAEALQNVRHSIDEFVSDADQFDDLTLLAFRYGDKIEGKEAAERTFDAKVENLHEVLDFISQHLESRDASMKVVMTLQMAVEELFVNIASYAYTDNSGKATIGINISDNQAKIYLIDNGKPFNPLEKEDPDVNAKAEEREVGGLGIYMVKNSVDSCLYERRNNENVFTIINKLR